MQPYVFGIMGISGVDRSIMVERLMPELIRRGHRVAVLREDTSDNPIGEMWQYQYPEAAAVAITGSNGAVVLSRSAPMPIGRLLSNLGDVSVVLAEGFARASWPKLEVHRGVGPLACTGDHWLVAVAGPAQPRGCPVPWYHWDEIEQIANAIENARSLVRAAP